MRLGHRKIHGGRRNGDTPSAYVLAAPEPKSKPMATAHDVAAYVIEKTGPVSAMKLQKLVYYSQAWSSVWDDEPLFDDRIEAWANGPVVRSLYGRHRGEFKVSSWATGDPSALTSNQKESIDRVLGYYGSMNAQQLSDLTHSERPWIDARVGLADGERGEEEISLASMSEYYSGL